MIVSRKLGAACVADIGWLEVRERVVERRPWVCRLVQSVSGGLAFFNAISGTCWAAAVQFTVHNGLTRRTFA
jgi:hypothetical protein